MLKHLHIENYAIIDSLDIDFGKALNTITGETGAGKSIILGALGLLSGARADSSSIAQDEQKCIIEGEFLIEGYGLEGLFEELELEWEREITIRRVVQNNGKSRAFISDMPVTLQTLKNLCEALIDIHSQHQTLLLARVDFQREIVDAVATNGELYNLYTKTYREMVEKFAKIKQLKNEQTEATKQKEFITYQIEQLTQANIKIGEQEELEEEQQLLQNATKIIQGYSTAKSALEEEQVGVLDALRVAENALEKLSCIDKYAAELQQRIKSCYIELQDVATEVEARAMSVEINPLRLEVVEERLDLIYTLSKKHNVGSGDELLSVFEEFEEQLDIIEGGEEEIKKAEMDVQELQKSAEKLAGELSKKRRDSANGIEKFVVEQLLGLGIKHPQFIVEIEEADQLTSSGKDTIKFLFSANQKSTPQKIEGVASGGEMSRLMLAIKNLVSKKIKLPTIIFDEIDTGVSGAVADSMGGIIESMSESMQVFNITHLPQVAAKGQDHFEVYKDAQGTKIKRLDSAQRVETIAQMLSGSTITDAARQQAKTLLEVHTSAK